jgi:hypothetical protein
VDYEVEVATSDRFNAGTSAHPFVNILGLQGSTGGGGRRYQVQGGFESQTAVPLNISCTWQHGSHDMPHLVRLHILATLLCLLSLCSSGRVNLEAGLPSGNDTDGGSAGTLPAVCSTTDACRPRSTALQRGGQVGHQVQVPAVMQLHEYLGIQVQSVKCLQGQCMLFVFPAPTAPMKTSPMPLSSTTHLGVCPGPLMLLLFLAPPPPCCPTPGQVPAAPAARCGNNDPAGSGAR